MAAPFMAISTAPPLLQSYMPPWECAGQTAMLMQGARMLGKSPGPHPEVLAAHQRPGRRHEPGGYPLLDEYCASKTRRWVLKVCLALLSIARELIRCAKDISGYAVQLSGDPLGSRFMRQAIETASIEEKQAIFDEIVPNSALQLMLI